MKRNEYLARVKWLCCLIAILLIGNACRKDKKGDDLPDDKTEKTKMDDLVISDNFNYDTTKIFQIN